MPVAERAQSGAGAKMSGILELIATKAFPELLTNVISTYKKNLHRALWPRLTKPFKLTSATILM
jgi:hypothetical protein